MHWRRTARSGFVILSILFLLATLLWSPRVIHVPQLFWAQATGVAFVLAGLAVFSRVRAVLGARLPTAMLLTFGALVSAPRLFAHPSSHQVWAGNVINLLEPSACWMISTRSGTRTRRARDRGLRGERRDREDQRATVS